MKLTKLIVVLLVLVAGTAFAAKNDNVVKFGYIDFNKALNEVNEGKKAKAKLQKEFNEKQKELEKMQNKLKSMKAELEKQRLLLSPEALQKKEEVYRKTFMDMQQKLYAFKQEMANRETAVTQGILDKLKGIVKEIGDDEHYTMILEKSQDVVLYSPSSNDLTDRVIKIFNKSKKKR